MAVTRTSFASAQSKPATLTPPEGSKRYLLILTSGRITNDDLTAVTINGVSLTKICSVLHSASAQAWGVVIPDGWSGALDMTYTGGTVQEILWFTGVDPDSPVLDFGTAGSGVGTDTSASCAVDCDDEGYVQTEIGLYAPETLPTRGPNQTSDYAVTCNGSAHLTTPVDGAVTVGYSFSGSRSAMVAVSLNPYISSPAGSTTAKFRIPTNAIGA